MNDTPPLDPLRLRHLRWGFLGLAVFVALGAVLEGLHGFKSDWYLAVGNETRRLLWRLAHAHGAFLSLLQLGFAAAVPLLRERLPKSASPCLCAAQVALPAGFWLGGIDAQGGDPGVAIALVPLGALLLVVALVGAAGALPRAPRP